MDLNYRDVCVKLDGTTSYVGEEKRFFIARSEQIANFADYCNHCGNCDTFCPEYDGPYLMKPSLFGSREALEQGAPHDGFFADKELRAHGRQTTWKLRGRVAGQIYQLESAELDTFSDSVVTISITPGDHSVMRADHGVCSVPHVVDMGKYFMMRTLLRGLTNARRVHPVNAAWLVDENTDK